MKRFSSQSRIVAAVTLLCVGLALWWSWRSHENAAKAQGHLRTIERSWQVLAASDPAPTAEVAAAWERRVAALESRLQQTRRALGENRADPVRSTAAPAQRAEAFFALAQFVEAQRTQAAQAGVRLADRYEFGFSAYSNSGPVDAELPIVHRQHLVVKALLESLWGSGARELTRVQREAADTKVRGGETSQRTSRRDGRPEDYFELSPGRELARDGFVDTLAFRVGFVGKTAALRRYLAALRALPMPLIVRAVEVEPLDAAGRARGGARSLADLFRDDEAQPAGDADRGAVPIIASNDAEFLVTVLYLDFQDAAESNSADEEASR